MGIAKMHSPEYWRKRAEEFRTKADHCELAGTRDALRQVARNFDELARTAEQIRVVEDLAERRGAVQEYIDDRPPLPRSSAAK
ncbi:hypothetical protein ACVWXM_002225 [Bradyrhizobium sp. GM7.3]